MPCGSGLHDTLADALCVGWAGGCSVPSPILFHGGRLGRGCGQGFMRKRYRRGLIDGALLARCASCRKDPTDAELKLWYHLRRRNLGYGRRWIWCYQVLEHRRAKQPRRRPGSDSYSVGNRSCTPILTFPHGTEWGKGKDPRRPSSKKAATTKGADTLSDF